MIPPSDRVLNAVSRFALGQIDSDDIDPVYPVLRALHRRLDLDEERALWLTALYLGYYNLTSALKAFRLHPFPQPLSPLAATFPCATERRGLRGGKVIPHIQGYLDVTFLGQRAFIQDGWGPDPIENYLLFWDQAQTVNFNGRWAAFKWSEILRKVHGYPLMAPDMRLAFCSGPREGLEWLYSLKDATVPQLNEAGRLLAAQLAGRGVPIWTGPEPDWESLETVLCDFNSTRKGHYYVGHDIDQMLAQIKAAGLSPDDERLLLDIRREVFPADYLGELNGWDGVDKDRRKVYQRTGVIVWR